MIINKLKKMGIALVLVSIMASVMVGSTSIVSAQPILRDGVYANVKETRAIDTQWRFKTVDGKLYRRLYDITNNKWLTDWILCG